MAYLYDLTDTWNAAGTVFNAIKMNVTNSASAAGSKIVTLQVGATERFSVDKDGNGYFLGTVDSIGALNSANLYLRGNSGTIGMADNSASILAYNGTGSGGITNALRFITGAAERMRIDQSGNVGIGTSSPSTRLNVIGDIQISRSTTASDAALNFGSNANNYIYGGNSSNVMVFATNSSERLRIDNNGNVGVGTSTPSSNGRLSVNGNIVLGPLTRNQAATQTVGVWSTGDPADDARANIGFTTVAGGASSSSYITFATNNYGVSGGERMRIDQSGNVGIGTSSPGQKLDVNGSINAGTANGVSLFMADSSAIRNTATAGNTMYFDSGVGTGSTTGDFQFRSTASFTTRLYINGATGSVGVGTTSPARLFEVTATGTNIPARLGNSQGSLDIGGSDGVVVNIDTRSWAMGLQTGGTERMRIDTSGNVVIGATSAAGARFNVTTASAADVIYVDANTAGAAGTAVYVLPIRTASTFRGGVRWNGTSVEYNTTSDIRLKENITDADDASALIDAIQVRKFDWKETGFHQRYGFVAQELVEVAPEAVSASSDPEEMMGVDYSKLVPMLIKELQSLRARVAQLEGN